MKKLPVGQPINTLPLSFLDVETTGLVPVHGHRICEVALIRTCGDTVETTYNTLVNPRRPIEAGAFAVNRISPDMLRDAPGFDMVVEHVLKAIEGSVIIAHNAPFDMAFMTNELQLLGYPPPDNPVIDTLVLARSLLSSHTSHSLPSLSRSLGLSTPNHRAMSDVVALRGLFTHLVNLLAQQGIENLDDIARYQRGLMPGDPEPVPPPIIEQALRQRQRLRIAYRSQNSGLTERTIQPIELALVRGTVHLRAYCYLRKALRSFVLARIESIEVTE
jgi:DNA polymerase-3 subunit epsilon